MSNAKIIYRLAFGAYVGGGEVFSLASALTLLLATRSESRVNDVRAEAWGKGSMRVWPEA